MRLTSLDEYHMLKYPLQVAFAVEGLIVFITRKK